MTEQQYANWLRDPSAVRVLLAELHHANGVEYVATRPYISKPADSLSNQPFNDVLASAVDVSTRLDAQVDLGDIKLTDDGHLTHWREYSWAGWPVVLRLGDSRWSYDDFRVIANQINAGISSARRGEIVMGIYDATAQLDTPIERDLINGQPVPLVFGSVFGGVAMRVNTTELRYRASWLPVTGLVVRDGTGPVISHTSGYSNGSFVASAYSPRTLSCEITEPHNTPALIISWVANHYGITVDPALALPSVSVGLRYDGDVSGRQILDDVCSAIGAFWQINLLGQLTVQRLEAPGVPDLIIDADDIEYGRIALVATEQPWRSLSVNYGRNYNVLSEVAGSIEDTDPALAERLRTENQTVTQTQALPSYPLAEEVTRDLALTNATDATAECARLLALRSVQRERWELTIMLQPEVDLVGKTLQVNHPRLTGRTGRIISNRMAPIKNKLQIEVWY
jgi:hypothetical protein